MEENKKIVNEKIINKHCGGTPILLPNQLHIMIMIIFFFFGYSYILPILLASKLMYSRFSENLNYKHVIRFGPEIIF